MAITKCLRAETTGREKQTKQSPTFPFPPTWKQLHIFLWNIEVINFCDEEKKHNCRQKRKNRQDSRKLLLFHQPPPAHENNSTYSFVELVSKPLLRRSKKTIALKTVKAVLIRKAENESYPLFGLFNAWYKRLLPLQAHLYTIIYNNSALRSSLLFSSALSKVLMSPIWCPLFWLRNHFCANLPHLFNLWYIFMSSNNKVTRLKANTNSKTNNQFGRMCGNCETCKHFVTIWLSAVGLQNFWCIVIFWQTQTVPILGVFMVKWLEMPCRS